MTRNDWYIACASSRLDSKPRAVRLFDLNLALFRDRDGKPHALLDRCCHRGVRLSLGKVVDGTLQCHYHGWRYSGEGQCTHVPSLLADQKIPGNSQVPSYPCVEKDGYIWLWPGQASLDHSALPQIPSLNSYRWSQGSIPIQCDAIKAIENNMDWCHPFFSHPWTHGQYYATRFRGFHEQQFEMRLTPKGLDVFTPVTANAGDPIPQRLIVKLSFELPNRVTVEFWKPFHMIVLMHFVPTAPNACRLEWLVSRLLPIGAHLRWTNQKPKVFEQDRILLESAQPWYDNAENNFERSVVADTPTLMVRRIVQLYSEGTWQEKRSRFQQRRIVTVRA